MAQRLDDKCPLGKEIAQIYKHFSGFFDILEAIAKNFFARILDLHFDHVHVTHPLASAEY
jgi:hypothetical protein